MITPWDTDISECFEVTVGIDTIELMPRKSFVIEPTMGLTITLPPGYTIVKEEQ